MEASTIVNAAVLSTASVHRAACPHDCPDTCAMRVTVEQGRVVKVQGDPDHPPTAGTLCTKVARYPERIHHQERLLYPLRRIGRKGEGRFERISWDEAIATVAQRLGAIAAREPQAIVPYSYAGTMGLVQGESMAARFFHRLGASLLDRTICASAGATALKYTYGASVGMDVEQFDQARLIIIWGSNPVTSSVHFWALAQEAKRRGARLIAIDPYRSQTAEKCHQHIAPLPGTDAALALGIMHVLIQRDLLDHDYIARHTLGFDALRERALQYSPQRVAQICGISAEEIEGLAEEIGVTAVRQRQAVAIRLNYGMQRVRGGGMAVRAVACLPALIGAWRHAAGGLLMSSSGFFPVDLAALQRPDLLPDPARPPRMINMSTIGDALLHPGDVAFGPKVEAVVVYNSNPLAVAPDSSRVAAGFAREDLFTVVIEHFQTDTADYADVVLPATMQLEHLDVHKSYGHRYVVANFPALAAPGECRPNTEVFRLLAARMGYDESCFADSDETLARQAIDTRDARAAHISWDFLREHGWAKLKVPDAPFAQGGFLTPSGKCEFYSERMKGDGLDPVPDYIAPLEAVDSPLARQYPLAMISPPARHFMNSTFVNVYSLRGTEREPALEMHADDAAARAIRDGQRVRVFNSRGSIELRARVSERARRGVVVGFGVWWRKLAADGKNVNELTSQALTDMGRAPVFYDCLVEVAHCDPQRDPSPV